MWNMNGSLDPIRELNVKCLHFMWKYLMGENDGYITGLWTFIYYSIFFLCLQNPQNFKSLKERERIFSAWESRAIMELGSERKTFYRVK